MGRRVSHVADACRRLPDDRHRVRPKQRQRPSAYGPKAQTQHAEPQNPDLLLFLGRAYNAANRAQDAQRVLDQALAISPDYPDVHLLLGIRNFADGHLRSARDRFERFLALAPDRRDEVEVWIERTRQAPQ